MISASIKLRVIQGGKHVHMALLSAQEPVKLTKKIPHWDTGAGREHDSKLDQVWSFVHAGSLSFDRSAESKHMPKLSSSSISQNLLLSLAIFECLDANIASPSSPSFPIYMVYGKCWQGLTFSDLKAWHHPIANFNSTTQHGRMGGWSDFRIWSWSRLVITEESKPFTFSKIFEAGLMGFWFRSSRARL